MSQPEVLICKGNQLRHPALDWITDEWVGRDGEEGELIFGIEGADEAVGIELLPADLDGSGERRVLHSDEFASLYIPFGDESSKTS